LKGDSCYAIFLQDNDKYESLQQKIYLGRESLHRKGLYLQMIGVGFGSQYRPAIQKMVAGSGYVFTTNNERFREEIVAKISKSICSPVPFIASKLIF